MRTHRRTLPGRHGGYAARRETRRVRRAPTLPRRLCPAASTTPLSAQRQGRAARRATNTQSNLTLRPRSRGVLRRHCGGVAGGSALTGTGNPSPISGQRRRSPGTGSISPPRWRRQGGTRQDRRSQFALPTRCPPTTMARLARSLIMQVGEHGRGGFSRLSRRRSGRGHRRTRPAPGAEDDTDAGLASVDLSVRVPAKTLIHLPGQHLSLDGPHGGRQHKTSY
jgi:hypothetical protein